MSSWLTNTVNKQQAATHKQAQRGQTDANHAGEVIGLALGTGGDDATRALQARQLGLSGRRAQAGETSANARAQAGGTVTKIGSIAVQQGERSNDSSLIESRERKSSGTQSTKTTKTYQPGDIRTPGGAYPI